MKYFRALKEWIRLGWRLSPWFFIIESTGILACALIIIILTKLIIWKFIGY